MGKTNTESESHKQKLITEFTPFPGLCLWVPLQWVPIQLISLKWYKMVLESTSTTVNRMMYKVFKTSLLEITISLQKAKKAKIITENVDFHSNNIWTLHSKNIGTSFLLSLQASHNRKVMLDALNNLNPPLL